MIQHDLILAPIRRVSPSRFTAMRSCLLREAWTAAGNEPLLPLSPKAELGSIIHQLLGGAVRRELEDRTDDKIQQLWSDLVSLAEKRMALSALRRHQVPLSRSIPDYEVRRLRACHGAAEIARVVVRGNIVRRNQGPEHTGSEVWIESPDGQVGGYIDRVTMRPEGVVLSDFKSGAVLVAEKDASSRIIRRAYKEQMILYAALYHLKHGIWPVRLEVVPLQGEPLSVPYGEEAAQLLLMEASALLHEANQRIKDIESGRRQLTELASPRPMNCRLCLFRPACPAYWFARTRGAQARWPVDVRGVVRRATRLRNGKLGVTVEQEATQPPSCVSVRNLTFDLLRHPVLHGMQPGNKVTLYNLQHDFFSNDYIEAQNTVIFIDTHA